MSVHATSGRATDSGADTIVVGIFEGEEPPARDGAAAVVNALVDGGEARRGLGKLAVTHGDGRRFIVVGLGARAAFDPERAREAAASALERARGLGARRLCWELPAGTGDDHAGALVEGSLLAAYRYRAFKSDPTDDEPAPEQLIVCAPTDVREPVHRAAIVAEAVNAARDLQNAPGNHMTPRALAERARALPGVDVEVMDRAGIEAAGMGAFAAVAQGSGEEPQLITLRYEPAGAAGPRLGVVGKAVTFDAGGLSIKPQKGLSAMRSDMSGGAAALEATGAIARLGLPVRIVTVIGATENVIGERAMKPGDIVSARNGTTVEIVNTDAEGRLVLADCLTHAIEQGAERLVDLATLTGSIVGTLGPFYAGLFANDDAWSTEVATAGERAGEPLWRLPLHPRYAERIEGGHGDIVNHREDGKAGAIVAAEFLHRFAGDVPWAHLDIAGTAWESERPYAPEHGCGYGVRLLVELASRLGNGRSSRS